MAFCSCTYKEEGCLWVGSETALENHVNLENLTAQSWLNGCDYPKLTCLFCNDEEHTRREYKEKLSLTNSNLTIDNLNDVLNTSWSAQDKWRYIGLDLGISAETLNVIALEERKNKDCFRRVIEEWLNAGGERNWAILRESVRDFKVGYVDVAQDILITATCKKGKKFIYEKYTEQMENKTRQAEQLSERARQLANEYKKKRKDVERKIGELSNWQGQLKQHESEYKDLLEVHEESASMKDQLKRCQQNVEECKEKIRGLENDIVQGRSKLQDIDTDLTKCKTQLQITLNELKHCKEILKRNESSLEEERKKNIHVHDTAHRIVDRVAIGGVVTYLVGFTVAFLSPLTGPLAPIVAGAGLATFIGGFTVEVGAGVGAAFYDNFNPAHFNEEQKKVDREYSDVSARCKETIKHVEEVAMEARKRVEELRLITVDYDKALSTI